MAYLNKYCPYHGAYVDSCADCKQVEADAVVQLLNTCDLPLHPLLRQSRPSGLLMGVLSALALGIALGYGICLWTHK